MDSQKQSSTALDLYQIVNDQVIWLLDHGVVPWQVPWKAAGAPQNLLSKRAYRGINLWLLNSLPYEKNFFLTWEQLKSVGGSVNKNETGHVVVYWKNVKKKPEEKNEDGSFKTVPMLRYYKVFNVAQCSNVPEHLFPVVDTSVSLDPVMECEAVLSNIPDVPHISFQGKAAAYYHLERDEITMPKMKSFKTSPAYYATLFHELVHSTGAEKRLNRKTITDRVAFGSESYAMEELVAEMGAAYLCQYCGLTAEVVNSASYIQGWLEVFKNDKKFILGASGQAQKAVEFLLNRQEKDTKEEVEEVKGESVNG